MPEIVRISTAGSVDDGKSTLIGRLLFDSHSLMLDQVEAAERASRSRGGHALDLAMFTDGLRAEREQRITIDVAYRRFETPLRKFILADTPGHAEFTRNMVTGTSMADVSVILLDVTHGVVSQSRRHAAIAALLQVPQVVVAVNKMDLAGFSKDRFDEVTEQFAEAAKLVGLRGVSFIPVSALNGDNVVDKSPSTPWYEGPTLLSYLEHARKRREADGPFRMPVQCLVREGDTTLAAGQIERGKLVEGESVLCLPAEAEHRVDGLRILSGTAEQVDAGHAAAVRLEGEPNLKRGDMLASLSSPPSAISSLKSTVCWMGERPAQLGARYLVRHTSRTVEARIDTVRDRLDLDTLSRVPTSEIALNDIADTSLSLEQPIFADDYSECRSTGSFIVIDPESNATVGAGIVHVKV